MKKTEAKYQNGTDIVTLVGKSIKNGYVFANTKGTIKSYKSKTSSYNVTVNLVNDETKEVEYKETELMLADIYPQVRTQEVQETTTKINDLKKNMTTIVFILLGGAVVVLLACLLLALNITNLNVRLGILIGSLVLLLALCILALYFSTKYEKQILSNKRKIEAISLLEQETNIKNNKVDAKFQEVMAKLNKLKELKEAEEITDKEYETARKKIIRSI